ncbi:trace amine-associated receptor 2 [Octopus bimaculoides]|uniref:G-protein coupled receptors family 1 profile domain-containing protein n=1 Tax=Octopus bimaculoides TaxID=37653 RepID=A0A0L8GUP3_OCTBM|nr:trace amine-associated receptor 2 [Octopus bimaculoides]WID37008.1 trace amine-associated receptor 2-like [Octopus bimaculoides]|eukprot:XP_014777813.1 PREDICTED: trace amine-associated receptor 2-like [Octopus bimaculoides]
MLQNDLNITETLDVNALWERQDTMAVFSVLIMVVILFGNGTVVISIIRYQHLRTPTNHFVLTLALTDIMLALSLPYHTVSYVHPFLTKQKYACLWRYISYLLPCGTSQTHVLAITLDRYLSVVHPLHYSSLMSTKKVFIISGLLWLYSSALGFVPIYWNYWDGHSACNLNIVFPVGYMIILVVQFFFISIIVIILYLKVFAIAKRIQKGIMKPDNGITPGPTRKKFKNSRSLLLYGIVVCLFCFLWTPFFTVVLIQMLWFNNNALLIFGRGFTLLGLTTSITNPVTYVFLNKGFHKAYRDMFHLKKRNIFVKKQQSLPHADFIKISTYNGNLQ